MFVINMPFFLKELWKLMKVKKKYWLLPIAVMLVLGVIVVVIDVGAYLAFVYP